MSVASSRHASSATRHSPALRCRRLQKELQSYHTDLEKQRAKVARMREEAADEYDIKKQVRARGARRGPGTRPGRQPPRWSLTICRKHSS